MSKYQPLADFLRAQDGETASMTFAQIERVLGARLPSSAYDHAAWWANDGGKSHVQAQAWLGAGFAAEQIDLKAKRLVFRKVHMGRRGVMEAAGRYDAQADKSKPGRHPAFGALKGTFTIAARRGFTKPAQDRTDLDEMEANLERTANLIEDGLRKTK